MKIKLNIMRKTGKLTGKLVGATKTAPSKTKNGLTSAASQFKTGFQSGIKTSS